MTEKMYRTSEGLKPESWVDEQGMFKGTADCINCGDTIYGTAGGLSSTVPICDACEATRKPVKRGKNWM